MKIKTCFQLALNILLHSKLRSWLTILGIVIGIAAVVSIVSISQGAQETLESQLGNLGADILTITAGSSSARGAGGGFAGGGPPGMSIDSSDSSNSKNLTQKDIIVIQNLENVNVVMGTVSGRAEMSYSSKSSSLSVTGVDPQVWKDITTEEIDSGRFLTTADTYSVVLGGNIITNTFKDGIPLNSKVTIEGKTFKVVGILESGSSVYMPIEIARDILDDVGEEEFDSILVKIDDVEISNETVSLITKKLMASRGILSETKKDFSISNPSEMQETMQDTMSSMTLFLTAIAAISLLVGAVGIANSMFTSVLEKTRDIGILKAIGAKNRDILFVFLINSGLIGLVGGFGGIIFGIFGSGLVSMLGSSGDGMTSRMFSSTSISISLLIFTLIFSVLVGMIAGAIPAYRASKLKPVDALRYQ